MVRSSHFLIKSIPIMEKRKEFVKMLFKSCGRTKEAGGYIVKTTGLDLIKVRFGQALAGNACSRCI